MEEVELHLWAGEDSTEPSGEPLVRIPVASGEVAVDLPWGPFKGRVAKDGFIGGLRQFEVSRQRGSSITLLAQADGFSQRNGRLVAVYGDSHVECSVDMHVETPAGTVTSVDKAKGQCRMETSEPPTEHGPITCLLRNPLEGKFRVKVVMKRLDKRKHPGTLWHGQAQLQLWNYSGMVKAWTAPPLPGDTVITHIETNDNEEVWEVADLDLADTGKFELGTSCIVDDINKSVLG